MRELLLFLIAAAFAAAVVGQPTGSPIPEAVRGPRQQDLLNYDINLAASGRVLLERSTAGKESVICSGLGARVVSMRICILPAAWQTRSLRIVLC